LLDEQLGLCVGCGRSSDEIASWASMPPDQHRAVMAILPARLERLERLAQTTAATEVSNP
jgi:predicted Fe-S protein YdhL (DUF1289 family)